MKSKKGVELTLNTVIIAVLALLVLLIVALIFTGSIKRFVPVIQGCEEKYGTDASCVDDKEACQSAGGRVDSFAECQDDAKVCCLFATGS